MDLGSRVEVLAARLRESVGCARSDIHVVCSPLRISPLGAHVDHQGGLVTGMTLDRSILLAFAPRRDGRIRLESLNYPGIVEFAVGDVPSKIPGDWGNYVRGAVLALRQDHRLDVGFDGCIAGVTGVCGGAVV